MSDTPRPADSNHVEPEVEAVETEQGDAEVWVIEDNALLRDTLQEVLDGAPGLSCTLAVPSCERALAYLEAGYLPDVVVMDLALPGMGGVEGTRRLTERAPDALVVVLTVSNEADVVFEAILAGATAYVEKPASPDLVLQTIRTVLQGGAYMSPAIARKVMDMAVHPARRRRRYGLSPREREVLALLVDGLTQREIAERLTLSAHTVNTHVRNVYTKLRVKKRTAAVVKALRERLL